MFTFRRQILLLVVAANVALIYCHYGHHHHHDHDDVKPSFKYSREANEAAQSDGHSHHSGGHHHQDEKEAIVQKERGTSFNIWVHSLTATLIISCVPYLILFFIPLDNSQEHEPLLKVLLAFASGGLLGDAFLHLIPHALIAEQEMQMKKDGGGSSHSHSHSHGHGGEEEYVHDISVGLWVLGGILVFLIIEKVIRIVKGPGYSHSHNLGPLAPLIEDEEDKETEDEGIRKRRKKKMEEKEDSDKEVLDEDKPHEIKVAGYLNLAADFTHNLTDGLAIGASFLAGHGIGVVTAITILLHEVPHEIGDFAILIQSGCSRRKAMWLQLITALGALTGTILSLVAEEVMASTTTWILPFTAGGFIYIATVSVIPELLEGTSLRQSIREIFALLVGVILMILIASYE